MVDDCTINDFAKKIKSLLFFIRAQKWVTQIYRALYGDAKFVSFRGTQTWRP